MAAKRRRLTDIVLSSLLPVLCAGLLGASPPAMAEQEAGSGEELQSQFNPPPAELKSQFNPTAFLRRQGPKAPAPIDERDLPGPSKETSETIRMIADQVSHDESLGIFVARGHVEILREGKIVKADVVTYNERTKRITAAGNVSLLEPDGDTQFATYADVTDDVKEGILYDFRMLMKDNARLAANRAYRVEQDTKEILRKGVYTPCAQCAEDPSRAPLWQIKAYTAIRDKVDEDHHLSRRLARDVRRAGALHALVPAPGFRRRPPERRADAVAALLERERPADLHAVLLCAGAGQGHHRHADFPLWRRSSGAPRRRARPGIPPARGRRPLPARRLRHGRGSRDATTPTPSDRVELTNEFRGHIEGDGLFDINENWRAGFDFKATTDKKYLKRWHLGSRDILTDTAYVEGFFGRSYAEARGYAFQSTQRGLQTDQLPIVAPMLDYRFVSEPGVAGAYWGVDTNFMNLRRLDGREVVRIAANPYWTLPYTSSMGDIYRLTFEMPTTIHKAHHVDPDSDDRDPAADADDFDGTVFRVLPKATFDWSYPFIRANPSFTQVFEPMFQLVAAPDTGNTGKIPNEDSRAFELDDTNLFLSDRFPGLDRKDTGSRATYGANWSAYLPDGSYVNAFLGQSFQFDHDDNDEFRHRDRHRRRPDRHRRPPAVPAHRWPRPQLSLPIRCVGCDIPAARGPRQLWQ